MKIELNQVDIWIFRDSEFLEHPCDSRALLIKVLSHYAPESTITLSKDVYGKPFVENKGAVSSLNFSLSHSDGLRVVAVTDHVKVGVDCENVTRKPHFDQLSNFYLSEVEQHTFNTIKDFLRRRSRFFEYWTLKEAYLKAIGRGLHYPLKKIEFTIGTSHFSDDKNENIQLVDSLAQSQNQKSYRFALISMEEHQIAIAVNNTEEIKYNLIQIDKDVNHVRQCL